MPYATLADMEARYGAEEILQLSDRNRVGAIDTAVIDQVMIDAHAVVDSHLRLVYSLPLSSVPVELVRVTCDLARYYLYGDRVTQPVKDRRDEAISWLRDVAAKRVVLEVGSSGTAGASGGGVNFSGRPSVFNDTSLAGY